jgi:hypothetical protein
MAKTYAALVAAALAAACTDLSSPRGTGPLALRGAASGVQQSRSFLTLDDEFAAIASAEPSFAGVYLDSTHTPVVLLTNTTRLVPARTAGVDAMLQKRHLSTGNLRVRPATYGFATLKQWYDSSLNDVASVPGFVFADIDEVQNRLHFGVETATDQEVAQEALVRRGIPPAAFVVDVTPRATPHVYTLRDSIRPLRGGLRTWSVGYDGRPGSCTLGITANTDWSTPDSLFFFTPTHCSKKWGLLDSTPYYQDTLAAGKYIGYEIGDREPWPHPYWGCPSGNNVYCRFSDAARNLVAPGVSMPPGFIARTDYNGITLVDPSQYPGFYVTSEASQPLYGQPLYKMGEKTGLTDGTVIATCVNVRGNDDPTKTLLCQTHVTSTNDVGDSGSPVFEWNGTDSTVALDGMLWGGDAAHYWFSPINNTRQDLGDFRAIAWPALVVTVSDPTTDSPDTYTWTANATGGFGYYGYQWQYQNRGSSTWNSLGTGASQSRYVDGSTPPFTLRVIVTSSSLTQTAYWNLGASISGPTLVWIGAPCTWTGAVTPGIPPYTFEWDVYGDGASNPVQVHTTSNTSDDFVYQTQTVGDSVTVAVTVTDAAGGSALTWLAVYSGGYGCGY